MKRIIKNQNGFGVIEILLIAVVVGLIGFVGYYAYSQQNKDEDTTVSQQSEQKTTSQSTPTSNNNQTTAVSYLTLEQYKVRIPLNDKTSKLTLGKVNSSSYSESDKSVPIIASELDSVWKCEADPDGGFKGSIGTVSISTEAKRSGPYEPLATKKIGNYTYGFEPGGSNCTDSPLYQQLIDTFKSQFDQIQSY